MFPLQLLVLAVDGAATVGAGGVFDGETGIESRGEEHVSHDGRGIDEAHADAEGIEAGLDGQQPVQADGIDDLDGRENEIDHGRLGSDNLVKTPFERWERALDNLL
jgi:hypothetical protein